MSKDQIRDEWATAWTAALRNTLAPRMGRPADVTWEPADESNMDVSGEWIWWSLVIAARSGPALYAGAPLTSWKALAEIAPSESGDGCPAAIVESTATFADRFGARPDVRATSAPRPDIARSGNLWPIAVAISDPTDDTIPLTIVFDSSISGRTTNSRLSHFSFPVRAVMGRTAAPLRDIFKMTTGTVVGLGKQLTDPVEILVNERLIAMGNVVLSNGRYAVRITSKRAQSREAAQ
jgi:flagellar motor switch protein FliN